MLVSPTCRLPDPLDACGSSVSSADLSPLPPRPDSPRPPPQSHLRARLRLSQLAVWGDAAEEERDHDADEDENADGDRDGDHDDDDDDDGDDDDEEDDDDDGDDGLDRPVTRAPPSPPRADRSRPDRPVVGGGLSRRKSLFCGAAGVAWRDGGVAWRREGGGLNVRRQSFRRGKSFHRCNRVGGKVGEREAAELEFDDLVEGLEATKVTEMAVAEGL